MRWGLIFRYNQIVKPFVLQKKTSTHARVWSFWGDEMSADAGNQEWRNNIEYKLIESTVKGKSNLSVWSKLSKSVPQEPNITRYVRWYAGGEITNAMMLAKTQPRKNILLLEQMRSRKLLVDVYSHFFKSDRTVNSYKVDSSQIYKQQLADSPLP